jgi:hypothetical protein
MFDLLYVLYVKYKRVYPIYGNGRGLMDSYYAWENKDVYVRLELMLVGCIGKQQCIEN